MAHKDDPIRINAEVLRKSLTYDINDDVFRAHLVDQLNKDQKPIDIPEAVKRSEIADKAFKECVKSAGKNILFNTDILISYLDEDARGVVSATATSLAIKFKKPVFLIYPVDNHMVITARSHRDNDINLGKLMERFSGGGHRVAASGAVRDEKDIGKIADRIRKEVKKIEAKK
jgi:c-di-AMP phosphodiesterase-like protein